MARGSVPGDGSALTVAVHVKPGTSRAAVGGRHGEALVVAVTARAVDGAATEATLHAVADALGLRRRQVSLRSGVSSRAKLIDLAVDAADRSRVEELIGRLRDRG